MRSDGSAELTQVTCLACGAQASPFNPRCARCGEPLSSEPGFSGDGKAAASVEAIVDCLGRASDSDGGPRAATAVEPGTELGRFRVVGLLGSGGFAIVVRAFDPALGREVAIKILRADDSVVRARSLREAQAMARLRHPNVVTVHEADTLCDCALVVMELVEGRTLRAFCAEPGRTKAEILRAFQQAGQGLAAIHGAGLVHRDFKPDNVLVDQGGRVQVTDFGLVGRQEVAHEGRLVGTPAYMAPEQHQRLPADARADQFAFCVALWEALTMELPFEGATLAELSKNVLAGRRRAPARPIPAWIKRILDRGLALDREARYPDMDELLTDLGRDPAPARRRRVIMGSALALAAVGGALGWSRAEARACDGAARLEGVWDAPRRAAVAAAFRKSGRGHAEASLNVVERALDGYAAEWASMRTDACRATRVRHEQSQVLLDLRVSCLDERREELRAYAELLAQADPALVDKAGSSAGSLSSLRRCSDAAGLLSTAPPPGDPVLRARIERTRAGLARVKALRVAGKLAEAHAEAAPLVAEARVIGYAPLLADALLQEEQIDIRPPDLAAAAAQLRDAVLFAERGHDEETQMIAWASLAFVQATAGERDAAIESMRHGEALLDGRERPPRLEAEVTFRLGSAASTLQLLPDAERLLLRALRALEKEVPPDDPALSAPHSLLGNVYQAMERHEQSLAEHRTALAIRLRAFGDEHPRTCVALLNLGGELEQADQLAEALDVSRRAVASCERSLGHRSWPTAVALMNQSGALHRLGRLDEAEPILRESLAVTTALGGDTSGAKANLAELESRRGRPTEATGLIEAALTEAIKRTGGESQPVRMMLSQKAQILLAAGRPQEAIAPAERLRTLSAAVPDGDLRSRALLGRVLVAAGHIGQARTLLAPVFDAEGAPLFRGKPIDLAAARFALARAILPGDAALGRELEARARAELAALGPAGVELLADLKRQLPAVK